MISSFDTGGDARGRERLFDVFGFGVRHDDSRLIAWRARCKGDEDVTFDCGWEDTEKSVVDVFTDQAAWVGVACVKNDPFWLWNADILDSPWSPRDVSRIPAETTSELLCEFDPFLPGNGRLDQR